MMSEKKMRYPNIEAERARKGMSVEEMTTSLGVCSKTYYNWCANGKIPQSKLEALADMFGVTTDYLLKTA